jgi:lactoylglutathione lyase
MPKTSKARAIGLNHIALEVGDIEEALAFYGACLNSRYAARASTLPSSIWALHFLLFRKAVSSPATMVGTSGWWSMTKRLFERP